MPLSSPDTQPPVSPAAANAAAYRHKLEAPHSLPGAAGKLGLYDDVGADDDDDTREKQQQRLPKQAHDNASSMDEGTVRILCIGESTTAVAGDGKGELLIERTQR